MDNFCCKWTWLFCHTYSATIWQQEVCHFWHSLKQCNKPSFLTSWICTNYFACCHQYIGGGQRLTTDMQICGCATWPLETENTQHQMRITLTSQTLHSHLLRLYIVSYFCFMSFENAYNSYLIMCFISAHESLHELRMSCPGEILKTSRAHFSFLLKHL